MKLFAKNTNGNIGAAWRPARTFLLTAALVGTLSASTPAFSKAAENAKEPVPALADARLAISQGKGIAFEERGTAPKTEEKYDAAEYAAKERGKMPFSIPQVLLGAASLIAGAWFGAKKMFDSAISRRIEDKAMAAGAMASTVVATAGIIFFDVLAKSAGAAGAAGFIVSAAASAYCAGMVARAFPELWEKSA